MIPAKLPPRRSPVPTVRPNPVFLTCICPTGGKEPARPRRRISVIDGGAGANGSFGFDPIRLCIYSLMSQTALEARSDHRPLLLLSPHSGSGLQSGTGTAGFQHLWH